MKVYDDIIFLVTFIWLNISDNIKEKGKPVFDFLLNHHLNILEHRIQYFVFQDNFNRVKTIFQDKNIVLHNCIGNANQWKNDTDKSFPQILTKLESKDVVFVDSLVHIIYQYGLSETYKILNAIKTQTCK